MNSADPYSSAFHFPLFTASTGDLHQFMDDQTLNRQASTALTYPPGVKFLQNTHQQHSPSFTSITSTTNKNFADGLEKNLDGGGGTSSRNSYYCNQTNSEKLADCKLSEQRAPKKRGPKKKPLTKEREVRMRNRRARANARERNRMHGLNHALESLRRHVPTFSTSHRLSKIETLRLAKNYIRALGDLLNCEDPVDPLKMALTLTDGLSQNTTNLVAGTLKVSPKTLLQMQRSHGGCRREDQPSEAGDSQLSEAWCADTEQEDEESVPSNNAAGNFQYPTREELSGAEQSTFPGYLFPPEAEVDEIVNPHYAPRGSPEALNYVPTVGSIATFDYATRGFQTEPYREHNQQHLSSLPTLHHHHTHHHSQHHQNSHQEQRNQLEQANQQHNLYSHTYFQFI